jgi:hypothetical protein
MWHDAGSQANAYVVALMAHSVKDKASVLAFHHVFIVTLYHVHECDLYMIMLEKVNFI